MDEAKISPPSSRTLGELRRFELKTDDPQDIEELDRVIEERKLSRRDLGVILLYLGVRPGFGPECFGIWKHNSPGHP
ncbi:hypothetical protein HMPREF1083_05719 [[Clostridium] clostridioforme 90A6]|jgi:hypothetical protein|uniref:Uncharacterized protein n=1 Tax=[Clostridium] clostridioforme 90A6 TaxID=999406 RepID=R0AZX9_9FIRM|nr:hypothetical protein [Enterocloster clostridioformis]ENZ24707.1 hypothetical protein HMPREF1087_04141 [[Clostridium] clostridioforme 90A1]ENZ57691.1 hypothetical protein HMPREF1083_05719 [[Clostridium] clostridioforme 90A6]